MKKKEVPQDKPHKGTLINWYKRECGDEYGLGYFLECTFVEHPEFQGEHGHTSYVISESRPTPSKHTLMGDAEPIEIETRNSRYTLV